MVGLMFLAEDTREDNHRDEVGQIVKAIQQIPTVTNEKRALIAELQNVAANHGYITFSAGNHRWHIGRIGESYFYRVPENKTGYLKPFAGQVVRVICVGSGTRWIRSYLAGVADET